MKKWLLLSALFLLTACSSNQEMPQQTSASTTIENSTTFSSEEVGLVYDVEDSEIVEHIIENISSSKQAERDTFTFRIYTANDYQDRNLWLTEAVTQTSNSYWLYIKEADKLTEISEQEFHGKLTGLQKQNQSEVPIYEEDNLS